MFVENFSTLLFTTSVFYISVDFLTKCGGMGSDKNSASVSNYGRNKPVKVCKNFPFPE